MSSADGSCLADDLAAVGAAEKALIEGDSERCRVIAEPIFRKYHAAQLPLTPELERLLGVFVAVGCGDGDAVQLLNPDSR